MAESAWYYGIDGQRQGPVPREHLQRLADDRRLGPSDLVWTEGMPDWQPASSIPGLFPAPAFDPPPPLSTDYEPPPPMQYYGGQPFAKSYQGFAIAGFVLAFFVPLLGLIFSWVALSGMKRTGNLEGKGLATAGMVISVIFLAGCMCCGLNIPMRHRF